MKILSIDIGIKNLALAIIEHTPESTHFDIAKWDIVSLCNFIPNCSACKKPAKFSKNQEFFCKQHTKKSEYKIPSINTKTLQKLNMKKLVMIAQEYAIQVDKSMGKSEMVNIIQDHINNTCFDVIEMQNANSINLIDIGINLKTELNKLFLLVDLLSINQIILENQISPIANRMKTIQGMIAQYFIDHGNYNIEFMSAANKLKLFSDTKKTTYNERKKMSINYTQQLLGQKNMEKELEFFCKHGKKDDLADCLLQGIYYLSSNNKFRI